MKVELPLFPLNLVVFPGEELRLHIFEPRYKQLIHDVNDSGDTFGIPIYFDGNGMKYGGEVTLTHIAKVHVGGEMDIVVHGIGWFEVVHYQPIHHGKLYPSGIVEKQPWETESDIALANKVTRLLFELYSMMKITNVEVKDPMHFRTWQVIHKIGLSREQEIEMLTLPSEIQKLDYMFEYLSMLVPTLHRTESIRRRAELNGHYQHIIPPEV